MEPKDSPFSKAKKERALPFPMKGKFDWLAKAAAHDDHIGRAKKSKLKGQFNALATSARKQKVALPKTFVTFIETPALHQHVRSVTGCSLDVAKKPLPLQGGWLVRFLADSQGAVFWYLFLGKGGKDYCVVASHEYFDMDEMDYELEDVTPKDFYFDGESFEAFVCRFWLDNEVLFAKYDDTPMPDVEPKVLKLYGKW